MARSASFMVDPGRGCCIVCELHDQGDIEWGVLLSSAEMQLLDCTICSVAVLGMLPRCYTHYHNRATMLARKATCMVVLGP